MEHKNEAPERIWITSETMSLYSNPSCDTDEEYIRKYAACVEVKEGYVVYAKTKEGNRIREIPLSEALTIRTVEDVRREAISKIKKEIKDSCPNEFDEPKQKGYIKGLETAIKLIDTPAPSREDCPECKGSGMRDSGGVYPWGEHIDVPCDCGEPQPTPSPDPEPVAWQQRLESGSWGTIFHGQEKPIWGEARPLYASPPTPASHAEELHKAEARIAELERSNDNLRQIERNVQAVREHDFQRAEKAEAALTEARARHAAADRMAEAFMSLWDEIRDEQPLTGKSFRECKAAMRAYCKETGHEE